MPLIETACRARSGRASLTKPTLMDNAGTSMISLPDLPRSRSQSRPEPSSTSPVFHSSNVTSDLASANETSDHGEAKALDEAISQTAAAAQLLAAQDFARKLMRPIDQIAFSRELDDSKRSRGGGTLKKGSRFATSCMVELSSYLLSKYICGVFHSFKAHRSRMLNREPEPRNIV